MPTLTNLAGLGYGDQDPSGRTPMRPAGDPDFVAFFKHEYHAVIGFLLKNGFDFHVAEDATAEAMTTAFRRWPPGHNPRGWVRTVAYRLAIKQKQAMTNYLDRSANQNGGQPTHDGTEAFRVIEHQSALLRLLNHLPDTQRLALALHLDGFTSLETAAIMTDITGHPIQPATARSNLRHARTTLKTILTDGGEALR